MGRFSSTVFSIDQYYHELVGAAWVATYK